MLVDSHCHLDYYVEAEIADVIARALEAGIGRMVTIGTRFGQAEQVKALTERFDCVWGTVGIHPHNAGEGELPGPEALAALACTAFTVTVRALGCHLRGPRGPRGSRLRESRGSLRRE